MLKCREVLGLGSVYVDDVLGAKERWSVRAHLLICSNCRAYIRKLKLTIDTVGELEPVRLDDSEVDQILQRTLPGERN